MAVTVHAVGYAAAPPRRWAVSGRLAHHMLVVGLPGAGKSTAVQQLLATVALDPAAGLGAVDGKELPLAGPPVGTGSRPDAHRLT